MRVTDDARVRATGVPSEASRSTRFLQVGLAFVFGYAAVSAMVDPSTYRAYLPSFLPLGSEAITDALLRLFAIYEVALALAVLTSRFRRVGALLAAATLLGIVLVNPEAFEVLFRNVAIALAALALAERSPAHRLVVAQEQPHRTLEDVGVVDHAPGVAATGPLALTVGVTTGGSSV